MDNLWTCNNLNCGHFMDLQSFLAFCGLVIQQCLWIVYGQTQIDGQLGFAKVYGYLTNLQLSKLCPFCGFTKFAGTMWTCYSTMSTDSLWIDSN